MMIRWFCYGCLWLMFATTSASALTTAMDCTAASIKWNKGIVTLNPRKDISIKPTLYFFHNISTKNILLDHPLMQDPGAKAGWGSLLASNHWSALLLNRSQFTLNCAVTTSSKTQLIDCAKVIKVCKSKIPIDTAMSGSYWYVENKAWDGFLQGITKRLKQ